MYQRIRPLNPNIINEKAVISARMVPKLHPNHPVL
jgi:hypothetical protein